MYTCNETDELCFFYNTIQEITDPPLWWLVFFSVVTYLILVLGFFGNLLTCIVVYSVKSMHTVTNYYLFNLAASDLIISFVVLCESIVYIYHSSEIHKVGDFGCKMQFLLIGSFWNNGILTLTVLSVERYIAIWHPFRSNRIPARSRVTKVVLCIWTVAILEVFLEMRTVSFVETKTTAICFIVPTTFARYTSVVLALLTYIIPLGIMTFMYTMVAFKVNVTQRNNSINETFNYRRNSSKINKLLIALTLSFLMCWLPFFFVRVLIIVGDWRKNEYFVKRWDLLLTITGCNGWLSVVLNPLLFSLMSSKFRTAVKSLWQKKVTR